jgi:hypothetical protein
MFNYFRKKSYLPSGKRSSLCRCTPMRLLRQTMLLMLLIVTVLIQAGCGVSVLKSPTPTPDIALTEISKTAEALRAELSRIYPTLTAGAQFKLQENAPLPTISSLPETVATPTLALGQESGTPLTLQPDQTVIASTPAPRIAAPAGTAPAYVRGNILALSPPTPVAQAGALLFQDDFSTERGWFTNTSETYTLEFDKGGYRFLVLSLTKPIWSVRSKVYNDVRVEVDAAQTAGPRDGYYGLVCRYEDDGNYYLLAVSPDGNFGIGKVRYGELTFLTFTDQFAGLLSPLGNRLRADCVGNTLSLYVNGTKVLETMDYDLVSGQVGMVVGNRSAPGTDVKFDNFIVLKP